MIKAIKNIEDTIFYQQIGINESKEVVDKNSFIKEVYLPNDRNTYQANNKYSTNKFI